MYCLKEEAGIKADKAATTVVVTGATTTLVAVINRDTGVAQCATTSTRAADQLHTVLIRVLVDVNPEIQDGYRLSADKVLFLLENQGYDDFSNFCIIYTYPHTLIDTNTDKHAEDIYKM